MSKKKKLFFLGALALTLMVLGALGSVLYLQSKPDGQFAQFLQRQGVPVKDILAQPHVTAVSQKLEGYIPGLQVQARGTGQVATAVSPTVFNAITIKGVIGSSSDSTALISADGQTHWLKVGEKFPVKGPKGTITLRCEEIRPGFVVLGVANSDLRKEYALR